jgi:hypothetical protein
LKPVRFRTEAKQELVEAAAWYGERSQTAKQHFLADFQKASRLILVYPAAWPPIYREFRKCKFSRFPYQLVYHEGKRRILVLAVMHCHQKPGYWKSRA